MDFHECKIEPNSNAPMFSYSLDNKKELVKPNKALLLKYFTEWSLTDLLRHDNEALKA